MEKKLKITNSTQFEKLVAELEKNPNLAKGFTRGLVPANFKKKWEEIAKNLNALGPPNRDSDGWQKVWRDFKFKVKRKMSHNKAECNVTGGGRYKQKQLSPLEEAVANLMQFEKQLTPDGIVCGVQDPGLPVPVMQEREDEILALEPDEFLLLEGAELHNTNTGDQSLLLEEVQIKENICAPSNATNGRSRVSTASRKKTNEQGNSKSIRDCLLQMHNDMQEKVFNEVSRSIISIKNTLKDTRKIEEEKLKLLKKKDKREEQMFERDMEIKKLELEIKKKKLQMLNEANLN